MFGVCEPPLAVLSAAKCLVAAISRLCQERDSSTAVSEWQRGWLCQAALVYSVYPRFKDSDVRLMISQSTGFRYSLWKPSRCQNAWPRQGFPDPPGALELVSEIREIGCLVLLILPASEVNSNPLGGPVLEGFGYVGDSDGVGSAQVGYGAGHFEDAMVGPCR